MTVRVLLFAVLRDAAATSELSLELPPNSTARHAANQLRIRYPALAPYLPKVAFAINQTYASPDTQLHDADELALIPPVSGG